MNVDVDVVCVQSTKRMTVNNILPVARLIMPASDTSNIQEDDLHRQGDCGANVS